MVQDMHIKFVKLPGNPEAFFNILPADWKKEIAPVWEQYAPEADIYVLIDGDQIVAGGVVAHGMPIDMAHFFHEVSEWVDQSYRYIGYLWVIENRRKQHLGSLWLRELAKHDPKTKYWLTIEEENLGHFYLSNGFHMVKKLQKGNITEWLLVKD